MHRNEDDFLSAYRLLLSVGHDEYWSKEMRDHVEGFIGRGGNVAFFSANVAWFQVRVEDSPEALRLICCKELPDPLAGKDDSRLTVEWHRPPVSRPENSLTGVSYTARGQL